MKAALLAILAAVAVLAACQPGASSGAPGSTPTPTPLASLTPEDLSDMIPGDVQGIILLRFSMTGEEFLGGAADPGLAAILSDLGAEPEDISVATAIGGSTDGEETATVFAFRVAGADADSMITAFQGVADQSGSPLDWHEATVGGKSVQVSSTNEDFQDPIVLYATGDILFFVTASDDSITEDILRKLP